MISQHLPEIDLINFKNIHKLLVNFIKEEVKRTGVNKIVLGLSGGIDSAVSCYLAVSALGNDNVTAILMPYKTSSSKSLEDAMLVVKDLNVNYYIADITGQIDAYFDKSGYNNSGYNNSNSNFEDKFQEKNYELKLRMGNKMARERMSILYDYSYILNSLVLGTSNKSELLLGYGTIYGDMASALNPIGDIYKTQIYQLAKHLGVPESLINKAPSADLWQDQSDEKELGFTYKLADEIMFLLVDKMYKPEVVISMGYDEDIVNKVYNKIKKSQFKRRQPLIAKVSQRTINIDFRYLRDWI
ncbi:MAG: NAD+ synthase [bacterium]